MKVITARGSFREVGRVVGEATREDIVFMHRVMVPELLQDKFGGDQLRMVRDGRRHFWAAEAFWPEAAEYIRGLAEGARLKLDHILPIAFMEEMQAPLHRDRCSTLLVRTENGWVLGHQEDYREIFYGRLSVLDLSFRGYPRVVSLTYPGTFPGMATSLNSRGLAMACNALWLAPVPGLGKQMKHFLAAMEASFTGALSWICYGPHILADHFVVIDGEEDLAASVEVTSHPEVLQTAEIREIVWDRKPEEEVSVKVPFTHANHVKWLKPWVTGLVKDPAHRGSAMRQRELDKIATFGPPTTTEEMLALFQKKDGILNRDKACNKTGQPNSVTIATTVISPNTKEIWFVGYGDEEETPMRFQL